MCGTGAVLYIKLVMTNHVPNMTNYVPVEIKLVPVGIKLVPLQPSMFT